MIEIEHNGEKDHVNCHMHMENNEDHLNIELEDDNE